VVVTCYSRFGLAGGGAGLQPSNPCSPDACTEIRPQDRRLGVGLGFMFSCLFHDLLLHVRGDRLVV
jgi:hypothetical protein